MLCASQPHCPLIVMFPTQLALAARALIFLSCLSLFLLQFQQIFSQYRQRATTTATSHRAERVLPLPRITICPLVPFKEDPGDRALTEEEYIQNTWDLEDLLHEETLSRIGMEDGWTVKESRLRLMGRCFTLEFNRLVAPLDMNATISLRHNASVSLAAHGEGEEIWLSEGIIPVHLESVAFSATAGVVAGDVHVEKSARSFLSNGQWPCSAYPAGEGAFTRCAARSLRSLLQSNLTCWTPSTRLFFADADALPRCDEPSSARYTELYVERQMQYLAINPVYYGCPWPCRRTCYGIRLSPYHRAAPGFGSYRGAVLYVFYDWLVVEERAEVLRYDFIQLVSAAGGSLGLFLGLSLLGGLAKVLDLMLKKRKVPRSPSSEKGSA